MLTVTNKNGLSFNVVVVAFGDSYGRNGSLVNDNDRADSLIEFYDPRYPQENPIGQFIGRYYKKTLINDDRIGGLDLHGGIPEWTVDGPAMREVYSFLTKEG
jgi:hypothetical protein